MLDHITNEDLIESLNVKKNSKAVFRTNAKENGNFFFCSFDNKFMIKTITESETKQLFNMLDDLLAHFRETKNQSMLARIYGVYTLKTNIYVPVNLMVMQNIARAKQDNCKLIFDLKGACFQRYAWLPQEEALFWRNSLDQRRVMMDANFIEIKKDLGEDLVKLSKERNKQIIENIKLDTHFLSKFGVMDYSLLLVVEQLKEAK